MTNPYKDPFSSLNEANQEAREAKHAQAMATKNGSTAIDASSIIRYTPSRRDYFVATLLTGALADRGASVTLDLLDGAIKCADIILAKLDEVPNGR